MTPTDTPWDWIAFYIRQVQQDLGPDAPDWPETVAAVIGKEMEARYPVEKIERYVAALEDIYNLDRGCDVCEEMRDIAEQGLDGETSQRPARKK